MRRTFVPGPHRWLAAGLCAWSAGCVTPGGTSADTESPPVERRPSPDYSPVVEDAELLGRLAGLRERNYPAIQGCYETYLASVVALVGDDPTPRPPPKPVDGSIVLLVEVGALGRLRFEGVSTDDFKDPALVACMGAVWSRESGTVVQPREPVVLEVPYTFESGWAPEPTPSSPPTP